MSFIDRNTAMRNGMKLIVFVVCMFWVWVTQFLDIDESTQYGESVLWLSELWVVKWYPDGEFKPDQSITRAEMMKIVLEASIGNDLDENASDCFSDVTDQWFAKYVCYGKSQWMIRGYPDGSFGVDNQVTVAEWLKIAINAFTDRIAEWQGAQWYQPYLEFTHTNSIFSKYAMSPNRSMSRAEVSEIAYVLYQERNGNYEFSWVRDSRSPWCFADANSSTPPTLFEVRWEERSAIVDIGRQVRHSTPAPLIVAFHGRTNSNDQVRDYYNVQREAEGKWIWIYPSGLPEDSSPRSRREGWDPVDDIRVYELFDEIVETYSEEYCVDMDRIFVVGHSLGWWVTNTLACARGDQIRAIWSVGGSATRLECTWPTAAIIMHHPEDRLASFGWGEAARDQILTQNSCATVWTPVLWWPADGNCVQYECQEWAPVVWCPHSDSTAYNGSYYPHTWPNFAAEAIWEFFDELE